MTSKQDVVIINQQKGKEHEEIETMKEILETNILSEESIMKAATRLSVDSRKQVPIVTTQVLNKLFNIMVDFKIPGIPLKTNKDSMLQDLSSYCSVRVE